MFESKNNRLAAIITLLFIALNSVLITFDFFWLPLIPAVLMVAYLYVFNLDKTLLLIAFLTPLAVNINSYDVQLGLSLPTEPLLILFTGIIIFKFFMGELLEINFIKHPVTIAIFAYLTWIFFTSITSHLPLVSFKFLAAKIWFIIPLYFFGYKVFSTPRNIKYFIWAYTISLIAVVVYTLIVHSMNGFSKLSAHWVMSPFYNDHTAYGAALAMFIPPIFGFLFLKKLSRFQLLLIAFALFILVVGIYFSISRAAWISVILAFGVFILIKIRFRMSWLLMIFAAMLLLFISFQEQILIKLSKNKQDSSAKFTEQVQSMSNIATDASNLERLNRWNSAFRLFYARPLVGWGPGTYQFVYGPFQSSADITIISTNAGNKGNAHSEYFGPLCEQGFLGPVLLLLILAFTVNSAIRVYRKADDFEIRLLALLLLLGIITYVAHGAFNNFLDTDKLSVPFWGFIAGIVTLDVNYVKLNIIDDKSESINK